MKGGALRALLDQQGRGALRALPDQHGGVLRSLLDH
jgi:hypothetical protein